MIELPESHVIADQMNQTLSGRRILKVAANASPHGFAFYFGDPAGYPAKLENKTIGKAVPLAGQIEVEAEDMRLLFNDGIRMRLFGEQDKIPDKHQLLLQFEDGMSFVCSVQMYGGLLAYQKGEHDGNEYYQAAKEKPTPYTEAFDRDYFINLRKAAKPSLSVKAFLATEQRIPGLGNGVLQDILYHARIHPKAKIGDLSGAMLETLFHSVKDTLCDMMIHGGRNTEKDLYGCFGGYQTVMSAKGSKNPCPSCGGKIVKQAYLGGNIYFCPRCQPENGKS